MHESSYDDCGCCADVHFGALLNQTSRLIRRALDARINAEVSSELSGVRGMVLGDIVRAKVLEAMHMACAGQPTYIGGKHGIIAGAYYGPASDELRPHQLVGDLELLPEPSSSDKINQVAGTFVDPITFKKTDFPAVIVPELNMGQISREVKRVNSGLWRVRALNRVDGQIITPAQILAACKG